MLSYDGIGLDELLESNNYKLYHFFYTSMNHKETFILRKKDKIDEKVASFNNINDLMKFLIIEDKEANTTL